MPQVAMVMDLNKCIGCQTCTSACKSMWTDEPGQEHMLWNNVETKPGPGYPYNWEQDGGGWKDGVLQEGKLPDIKNHGGEAPLNHEEVYFKGTEQRLQRKEELYAGANWDEDSSSGEYPNNYHFYVPRMCNHCTNPACLEACPTRAIYKREQDGVVLIDQDICQGMRECNKACPYDKIYFNEVTGKSQKCIFCFPRLEEGVAPACARQCPGRLRFVGFLDDEDGPIYQLVHVWRVALPLHPEYGTEPNVFYIPPILPNTFDDEGDFTNDPRVPLEYMRELFGPGVDMAIYTVNTEMEKKRNGEESILMDLLIAKDWKSLFNIPDVKLASNGEPTLSPEAACSVSEFDSNPMSDRVANNIGVQSFDPTLEQMKSELIPTVQV
jgi:nitrate reductase beta subunit